MLDLGDCLAGPEGHDLLALWRRRAGGLLTRMLWWI
jgi:hypothetical protein